MGDMVRRADYDRWFCSLFAPGGKREGLWLLYAFNHELARAREVASEPMMALVRLAWWREVVEGAERRHEVAGPLGAALREGWFERGDLLGLVEARGFEVEEDAPDFDGFMNYVRGTAGRLARVAGKYLGVDSAAVEDVGTGYGIVGALRAAPFLRARGRLVVPEGSEGRLLEVAKGLLAQEVPREAMAAALLGVLARRRLGDVSRAFSVVDRAAVALAAVLGRL
jgi:phytoene synthase